MGRLACLIRSPLVVVLLAGFLAAGCANKQDALPDNAAGLGLSGAGGAGGYGAGGNAALARAPQRRAPSRTSRSMSATVSSSTPIPRRSAPTPSRRCNVRPNG